MEAFMRFRQSCNLRVIVGPVLFAAALTAALVVGSGVSGDAAQGGLAYSELMKFVKADANPQPGGFAGDFQAAVDAQRSAANATQHHGIFGSIMNAANAAKGAVAIFHTGIGSPTPPPHTKIQRRKVRKLHPNRVRANLTSAPRVPCSGRSRSTTLRR